MNTCRICGSKTDLISNYYYIGGGSGLWIDECRECIDKRLKESTEALICPRKVTCFPGCGFYQEGCKYDQIMAEYHGNKLARGDWD